MAVSTLNPPFTRTHLIEDAGVPLDYIPVKMSFMSVDEVTSLRDKGVHARQRTVCSRPFQPDLLPGHSQVHATQPLKLVLPVTHPQAFRFHSHTGHGIFQRIEIEVEPHVISPEAGADRKIFI